MENAKRVTGDVEEANAYNRRMAKEKITQKNELRNKLFAVIWFSLGVGFLCLCNASAYLWWLRGEYRIWPETCFFAVTIAILVAFAGCCLVAIIKTFEGD